MTRKKSPLERWLACLATGSVLVAVAAALALIALARPVDDDFNLGLPACRHGFHYVFHHYYLNLSGRWAEVLLETFFLSRADLLHHYWMLLLGIHAAQWAALLAFWRLLWPESSRGRLVLMATLTYGVLWCAAPNPGETYYWFTGGVAYSLSLSLAILTIAVLVAGCRRAPGSVARRALLGAAFAMAPIVPAMHEVIGASLLVLCLIMTGAWMFSSAKAPWRPWLIFSTLVLAGFLICALAPGNARRAATFPNGHSVIITIKSCIKITALYVIPWLFKPTLWGGLLLLLTAPAPGGRTPEWLRGGMPWHWILPAGTLLVTGVCILIPSWAMGGMNGRLLTLTQQTLLLGLGATAVAWGARLDGLRRGPAGKRLRLAALLLLALSPWLMGNLYQALREGGQATIWSQALDKQFLQAREAKAAGKLYVEFPAILFERPSFFYSDGITMDPNDWRNEGFAGYFGLHSVRVRSYKEGG